MKPDRHYAELLQMAVEEQAKAEAAIEIDDEPHLIAAHLQRAAYYRSKAREALGRARYGSLDSPFSE